jgi:dihydrofolate reductase
LTFSRPLGACFAIAANGVMGRSGGLPWDHPEDRAHFFRVIAGRAILMGRRTFEETGRPIDGSRNIVVSRALEAAGVEVARSLDEGIALARTTDPEPIVIGGAQLLREAMLRVTHVWLTEIDERPEGDVVLTLDRSPFREIARRTSGPLAFVELVRIESGEGAP